MPVSTRMFCLPVRISREFRPAVMKFLSSGGALRDHITFGTTPKNAPPSSGYVPSETTVNSKSPKLIFLTRHLFQFRLEVMLDQWEEVSTSCLAGDAMRLVGVNHQPEGLVGLDERVNHLHAVLEVDVIVARSMY